MADEKNKEIVWLRKNAPFLILLALAFSVVYSFDTRKVPEDINVYGVVSGGEAEVRGVVWKVLRPDSWVRGFKLSPFMSVQVLIENTGDEVIDVHRVRTVVVNKDGTEDATIWMSYGGGTCPLPDVRAERIALFLGGG